MSGLCSDIATLNTECLNPHTEPPWRRFEYDYDIHEHIRFYLPENKAGTSVGQKTMPTYTMSIKKTTTSCLYTLTDPYPTTIRRTGFGVVAFRNSREITSEKGPCDTEMRALEVAATLIHKLVDSETSTPPLYPPTTRVPYNAHSKAAQEGPNKLNHLPLPQPRPTRPTREPAITCLGHISTTKERESKPPS